MKWYVDGHEFETVREAADYITENLDDSVYDDMLDEVYGEIEVCGFFYYASYALYKLDEIAYNCGRNDYYDSLAGDIVCELERMDNGETLDFYGSTVLCEEEEEEK